MMTDSSRGLVNKAQTCNTGCILCEMFKGTDNNWNILFVRQCFFLIGTPTLLCAECVHPSLWGRHPPDWFAHRQGSIITLLYSAALPVRQRERHIRAAHGDGALERRGKGRRGSLVDVACWGCCCLQADVLSSSVSHLEGERLGSSSIRQWLSGVRERSTLVLEMHPDERDL